MGLVLQLKIPLTACWWDCFLSFAAVQESEVSLFLGNTLKSDLRVIQQWFLLLREKPGC